MAAIKNLDELNIDAAALDIVPESLARENTILAVSFKEQRLRVVIPADSKLDDTAEMLRFILDVPLIVDTADRTALEAAVHLHYSAKYAQIDNCKPQFRFKCPKRWYDLEKTGNRNIRLCHQCGEQVFLCHSEDELKALAINGKCVALAETYSDVEWMGLVDFEKDGT